MKKESINTADRKYNIKYYSNSDKIQDTITYFLRLEH